MIYFITNNKIYEVNLKFLLNPFFVLFLDVLNLEISHKKCNMIANMIIRKLKSVIKKFLTIKIIIIVWINLALKIFTIGVMSFY